MPGAAVILAAGEGRRLGGVSKASLRLPSGASFLERILATLARAGVGHVCVVSGAHEVSPPAGVLAVRNPDPGRGMLSSIRLGIEALLGPGPLSPRAPGALPAATVIWPVDCPRVPSEVVERLIAAVTVARADVAVPCRAGRGGHPFVVGPAALEALLGAPDTAVTRDVLRAADLLALRVEVDAPEVLDDFDTPGDLARLWGSPT